MIVIDTNVVFELMRLAPDPAVMAWFSGQDSVGLHLTAVSEAELRAGAAILPAGRRRDRLADDRRDRQRAGSTSRSSARGPTSRP